MSKPSIELLNMDCMEYMAGLPDNSFDLVITSPPYNLGDKHHTGSVSRQHYPDSLPEEKYQQQQIEVLNELRRVIGPSGSLFYNHKPRIRNGLTIHPLEWISKSDWCLKQEIIWRNKSQNFDKVRAFPMTERVYWLANPEVKMQNECSLMDCMLENIWPAQGAGGIHGRSFPLQMVMMLGSCLPKSRLMYDPYLGSGTSAVAAHLLGRDFVGTELDPDYYKAAVERFDNETKQEAMF